jgi:hypothetical protein
VPEQPLLERTDLTVVLRRLLGSAATEVACDVCFEELDRYVELELDGKNADASGPTSTAALRALRNMRACGRLSASWGMASAQMGGRPTSGHAPST